MVRTCKYAERNQKEKKCGDYFIRHSKGGTIMCRLTEWKRKKGVCPYDPTIFSKAGVSIKNLPKGQTTLGVK